MPTAVDTALAERVLARIAKTDSCWLWTGRRSASGYGVLDIRIPGEGRSREKQAHRLVYQMHVGDIGQGLVLDHRCHVRHCVNPEHLRAVTHQQNITNRRSANRTSASGVRGVWWNRHRKAWQAQVACRDKTYSRYFHELDDAARWTTELRTQLFIPNVADQLPSATQGVI